MLVVCFCLCCVVCAGELCVVCLSRLCCLAVVYCVFFRACDWFCVYCVGRVCFGFRGACVAGVLRWLCFVLVVCWFVCGVCIVLLLCDWFVVFVLLWQMCVVLSL